jgi:hypothetical protein
LTAGTIEEECRGTSRERGRFLSLVVVEEDIGIAESLATLIEQVSATPSLCAAS